MVAWSGGGGGGGQDRSCGSWTDPSPPPDGQIPVKILHSLVLRT